MGLCRHARLPGSTSIARSCRRAAERVDGAASEGYVAAMRLTLLATFAVALLCSCAGSTPRTSLATSDDERAVLAVVDRLFAAMRTKDSAEMRRLFEPRALLFGMRTRPDSQTVIQATPWERFATFNASDRREWIERPFNPEVRVRGTLATVWAEYDFHFGSTPS